MQTLHERAPWLPLYLCRTLESALTRHQLADLAIRLGDMELTIRTMQANELLKMEPGQRLIMLQFMSSVTEVRTGV